MTPSRTTTEPYHHPPHNSFPPAEDCTDEDLLQIAALTLAGSPDIMTSSPHVTALCGLVERMDLKLRAAHDNARDASLMLIAEMRRSLELARLNAALSAELSRVRAPDTVLVVETGSDAARLQAAITEQTERSRLRAAQVLAHRIGLRPYAPQRMQWDMAVASGSVADREVVDPETLDEPSVSRTRTQRADDVSMAQIVEWRLR